MSAVSLPAVLVCAVAAVSASPLLYWVADSLLLDRPDRSLPVRSGLPSQRHLPAASLAVAVLVAGWVAPNPWVFAALVVGSAALIVVSMVDLVERRIPNVVTYPAAAVCTACGVFGWLAGNAEAVLSAVVAAIVFGTLLLVIHLLRPDGLGRGDVKLAFPLGFGIGWVVADAAMAPAAVGFALAAASILGLGLAFVSHDHRGPRSTVDPLRGRSVPFGPALSLASAATIALALAT